MDEKLDNESLENQLPEEVKSFKVSSQCNFIPLILFEKLQLFQKECDTEIGRENLAIQLDH